MADVSPGRGADSQKPFSEGSAVSPSPSPSPWVTGDGVVEKAAAGKGASRWRVVAGVVGLAVVAGVVGVAVWPSSGGGGGAKAVPSGDPATSGAVAATASSAEPSSPDDGPPYAAVPTFSSDDARDTAFVGDVGQFSSWPSGIVSYGIMSSFPGGSDVADFRKAVVKDARAVCDALAGGTDMEDVPGAAGVALEDQIDQAAFIVEAVTFYCPEQTAAVTEGVYSKPVPVEQDEDCPGADALDVSVSVGDRSDDEFTHSAAYTVKVRNTASYPVRAQLQQRWWGDGYSGNGEWSFFGDVADDEPPVDLGAGETYTYEGEQEGVYRWTRTEVRVRPGEFVFFGCGYQPGPGPGPGTGADSGADG